MNTALPNIPVPARELSTEIGVLIVDDSESIRDMCKIVLQKSGIRVVEASTLSEARDLLAHVAFDVVVADHNLYDGTGGGFLAEVAKAQPHALRVLMSGDFRPEGSESAHIFIMKTAGFFKEFKTIAEHISVARR